jgi:hypothetical protein
MRRPPVSLAGLVGLALLVRLVVLLLAGVDAPPRGDELAYRQIAENVAAGRGLQQDNNPFFPGQTLYAWQAPLYPLVLGIIYRFVGPSLAWAKVFGVVVSAATVYLVYDLARRVFGVERIALAAGLLVAIYPALITNSHVLLSETLFTFLVLVAFDCGARALDAEKAGSVWRWLVAAGVAWGLATLARGVTLYFTPLAAVWLGWSLRQPLRGRIVAAGLLAAASFLVVAPYTLRNHAVFGRFVLLETKGGVNLWLGNSPYTPRDFIRNVWKAEVREPMLAALPKGELERDRAAYALALDYIRREPSTFLARIPVKFADFWGFERYLVDNAETTIVGGGWHSPVKVVADLVGMVVYVAVLLAGVAGFVYAPEDRWKLLLGGYTTYFTAVHLVIFGDGRFHLPLIPVCALYAGWMVVAVSMGSVVASRTRNGVVGVLAASLVAVWVREIWAAWHVLRGGL